MRRKKTKEKTSEKEDQEKCRERTIDGDKKRKAEAIMESLLKSVQVWRKSKSKYMHSIIKVVFISLSKDIRWVIVIK